MDNGYARKYLPSELNSNKWFQNKRQVRQYKCKNCNDYKNHIIQIIPIKMTKTNNNKFPIRKFIDATFNLDICKNYFTERELYVRSWKKLIYKYDYIKINIRNLIYQSNINKLRFWDDDDIPEPILLSSYKKAYVCYFDKTTTNERLEKYKNRGFNIQIHPQQNEIYNT
jgi:hypothetical protein